MTLIVVGLNHQSTPLNVLEKLTFSAAVVPKLLSEVSNSEVVAESVVMSTCNRTEVYVQATRFHDAFRDIRESLATVGCLASEDFVDYLYVHYDDPAAEHLFSVAAGLDSEVLGEHEILGQVRRSWDAARDSDASGALLNLLFQRAIEAGKRVRSETAIGEATASLSQAAVALVENELDELCSKNVLLMGAGELGGAIAAALTRSGVQNLRVANRTYATAQKLASGLEAGVVAFEDLAEALAQADVLITATGADHHLLSAADIERATAGTKPLLIVDIALPRDVDPAADRLPDVTTFDLRALQAFANRGIELRRQATGAARAIIAEELLRHSSASEARMVAPLIGSLHGEVEAIRLAEIKRQIEANSDLTPEQRSAVEAVTRSVLAKVLHKPTAELKNAAGTVKGELLADAVRVLFDL